MVAILWGKDASTLKPMLGDGVGTIESVHPSPLSASRGFFGSKPFSRANALLVEKGAEPIDWQLP
jgi:uracil-DNA glycosylase